MTYHEILAAPSAMVHVRVIEPVSSASTETTPPVASEEEITAPVT